MDNHQEDRNRVHHEYVESEYDRDGRPEATKKLLMVHDATAGEMNNCPICKNTSFSKISAS